MPTEPRPQPRTPAPARPWTLPAAAALAAAQTTGLLVAMASQRLAPGPLAVLGLQYLFCVGALRRGAGSFLALVLYQGAALLFGVVGSAPGALRALVVLSALAVLTLLAASARLLPPPRVPAP